MLLVREPMLSPRRLAASDPIAGIVAQAEDAIILADHQQRILLFNRGAETIFGYRAEEVQGQPLDILIPMSQVAAHRRHVENFAHGPSTARRMEERGQIAGRRKDGSEFPAEASICRTEVDGEMVFGVILRDVTEHVREQQILKQAILEKEQLLKEVHHRVKNNLQVLTSLLNLRSRVAGGKEAVLALRDSHDRIHALALIHELLYRSGNLDSVDVPRFLSQLAPKLGNAHSLSVAPVKYSPAAGNARMTADDSIKLGLLLNEMIVNSMQSPVEVTLDRGEGKLVLRVQRGGDASSQKTRVQEMARQLNADVDIRTSGEGGLEAAFRDSA